MSHVATEKNRVQAKGSPSSTVKAPSAGGSSIRSSLAGMSYGAQAAALSPAVQAKKNAPAPANTGWTTTVRRNFAAWDKNSDGWINHDEVAELMKDPSIKGADAAAVAALHAYIEGLEELSNDETGDENDGVTLADLTKYERGNAAKTNPEDAAGADGMYGGGQNRINSANTVKNKHGGAKATRTTNELFPNGAPSLSALKQGYIGDCYFLAALGSVINRNPQEVVNMISRKTAKGQVVSYTVTFPQKSLGSVTVKPPTDAEIARYSSAGSDGLWLIVMEKAFAEAKGGKNVDMKGEIGEGDWLSTGVGAMGGSGTDTDDIWCTSTSTTKKKLQDALNGKKKKIVTAAISSDNELKLPSGHAYSVLAWSGTWITVRNPWGSNPQKVPAKATGFVNLGGGKFKMTMSKFEDVFSQLCYQE